MHFNGRQKKIFLSVFLFFPILLTVIIFIAAASLPAQADEVLAGPDAEKIQETDTAEALTDGSRVPAPFSVKIRFGDSMEKLTRDDTADWRWKTEDGYQWDDRRVSAYFNTLKDTYDTPYGTVNFKTHKGVMIQIESSSCGWHMNTEASVRNLENGVDSGEQVVDPAWDSGLVYSSDSEVGDKYVEVSISEQKVFLFEGGKEIYKTDCVTGMKNVSDTEKGVFQVIYKASPSTLKDTDADGNKYEQPVHYWIDFNGSQGMHDASWRSEFGGDIYETNGSHGCVNLPLDAAGKIYEEVYTYYPVIVY